MRQAIIWVFFTSMFISCIEESKETVDEPSETMNTGECRLNSDCDTNQVCENAVCVEQEEEASCTAEECPCDTDEQCDEGLLCIDSSCIVPECLQTTDCALSQECLNGQCVTNLDLDNDRDDVANAEDNCPLIANADQNDIDQDGLGDACDDDDDGDEILDVDDNCISVPNPEQLDTDGDMIGDLCEADEDGDEGHKRSLGSILKIL